MKNLKEEKGIEEFIKINACSSICEETMRELIKLNEAQHKKEMRELVESCPDWFSLVYLDNEYWSGYKDMNNHIKAWKQQQLNKLKQ